MKRIIIAVIYFCTSIFAYSQQPKTDFELSIEYFNNFQKYKSYDADSAIYYIQLLAKKGDYNWVQDLLHHSLSQAFLNWDDVPEIQNLDSVKKIEFNQYIVVNKKILHRLMTNSNKYLVTAATPIYYWTQVQQYENNPAKLQSIVNEFIKKETATKDIYENRMGRYALLIHQIIAGKKQLENLDRKLFTTTINKLKSNAVMLAKADTLTPQLIEKRSWYRYLYAYCNYDLAQQATQKKKLSDAEKYFKEAFLYSPDKYDLTMSHGYFYDMISLFRKEKETFQDDYIQYLKNHSANNNEILNHLLEMSLTNPVFKKDLKNFYTENFLSKGSFAGYWRSNVNNGLSAAPEFSLQKTNGEKFSSKGKIGKWILLDFWGTWCGPCRAEHPDLQKLYTEFESKNSKIEVLTIACRDQLDGVNNYMSKQSYTFPVAMADNDIENLFRVNSYPTKYLITPEGNSLIIPFGIDWVNFIKEYID